MARTDSSMGQVTAECRSRARSRRRTLSPDAGKRSKGQPERAPQRSTYRLVHARVRTPRPACVTLRSSVALHVGDAVETSDIAVNVELDPAACVRLFTTSWASNGILRKSSDARSISRVSPDFARQRFLAVVRREDRLISWLRNIQLYGAENIVPDPRLQEMAPVEIDALRYLVLNVSVATIEAWVLDENQRHSDIPWRIVRGNWVLARTQLERSGA
jgi:hypothetical protein